MAIINGLNPETEKTPQVVPTATPVAPAVTPAPSVSTSAPAKDPNDNDIARLVSGQAKPKPAPEGFWASAGREFLSDIAPATASLAGGIAGGAITSPTGPGAIVGYIAGSVAAEAGAQKVQNMVLGDEFVQKNEAQRNANREAQPFATNMGAMLPMLISLLGGVGGKVKVGEEVVGRYVTAAGKKALQEGAEKIPAIERLTEGAIKGAKAGLGREARNSVNTGEVDPAKYLDSAVRDAIVFGATALVPVARGILGATFKKAPADAAVMTMAGTLYDTLVHGQEFDWAKVAKELGSSVPAFIVQSMVMSALHAKSARYKKAKTSADESIKDEALKAGMGKTADALAETVPQAPSEKPFEKIVVGGETPPAPAVEGSPEPRVRILIRDDKTLSQVDIPAGSSPERIQQLRDYYSKVEGIPDDLRGSIVGQLDSALQKNNPEPQPVSQQPGQETAPTRTYSINDIPDPEFREVNRDGKTVTEVVLPDGLPVDQLKSIRDFYSRLSDKDPEIKGEILSQLDGLISQAAPNGSAATVVPAAEAQSKQAAAPAPVESQPQSAEPQAVSPQAPVAESIKSPAAEPVTTVSRQEAPAQQPSPLPAEQVKQTSPSSTETPAAPVNPSEPVAQSAAAPEQVPVPVVNKPAQPAPTAQTQRQQTKTQEPVTAAEPAKPEPPKTTEDGRPLTSIKNEVIDNEREARGVPAIQKEARKEFGRSWESAEKELDNNPNAGRHLVEDLNTKSRTVSDDESALLLMHKVHTQNELQKNMKRALDDSLTPEERANALKEVEKGQEHLDEIDYAARKAGTEVGRSLSIRRMMAADDFSVENMLRQKQIAVGDRPLEPKEIKEVTDKAREIKEATEKADQDSRDKDIKYRNDKLSDVIEQEKESQAKEEAEAKAGKGRKSKDKPQATEEEQMMGLVNKISSIFKETGDFRDAGMAARKLAGFLVKRGYNTNESLVDAMHSIMVQIHPEMSKDEVADMVSGYGKYKRMNQTQLETQVGELAGELLQKGKIRDMMKGKAPLLTGKEKRIPGPIERILKKKVNDLKKLGGYRVTNPETQLKDALGGIKTRLKNEIVEKAREFETGEKREKTASPEYDLEAEKLKALRDRVQETLDAVSSKDLTDQQKMDIAIKHMESELARNEERLASKDIGTKEKTPSLSGPELDALRAKNEAIKEEIKHLRDIDETIQGDKQNKQLQSDIFNLEDKIERSKKGENVFTQKEGTPKSEREDVVALRQEKEARLKELQEMRENSRFDNKKIESLDKQIASLKEELAEGGHKKTKGKLMTVDKEEILKRNQAIQDLKRLRKQQIDSLKVRKSDEEIALQAWRTRKLNTMAKYREKLATGDFEPATKNKRDLPFNESDYQLQAAAERAKRDFMNGLEADKKANRQGFEKYAMGAAETKRSAVLSSVDTLAKLSSAALEIIGISPGEQAIGSAIGKITGLSKGAERRGDFNMVTERKAVSETAQKAAKNFMDEMRTGQMDIDVLYGKRKPEEAGWQKYIGRSHAALKSSARQNEFTRSIEYRLDALEKQGLDKNDPMVRLRAAHEAYKDANSAIYREDNLVVKMMQGAIMSARNSKNSEGERTKRGIATEAGLKFMLPVTEIPSNYIARVFEYSPIGVLKEGKNISKVLAGQIDTLNPQEKDMVIKALARGSMGTTLFLIGFFAPDTFGGLYDPNEKEGPGKLHHGSIKFGNTEIPKLLVHHPLLMQLQLGATARKTADRYVKGKRQGIPSGVLAAAVGALGEAPQSSLASDVGEVFDARNVSDATSKFVGRQAASLIPPDLKKVAGLFDERIKDRKPKTVMDHILKGVPVLSRQVPLKAAPKGKSDNLNY